MQRKRAILTAVVAAVLLLAAVLAGINAVFTVTLVKADFVTCSEAGAEDAQTLKEELDRFAGKSSVLLDLGDLSAVIEKYPYFRVDSLKKKYPTVIEVKITERSELFALETEGGYDTLTQDGLLLRTGAEENQNRAGGENILLEGFSFTYPEGAAEGTYADELFAAAARFSETLTEARSNVRSVRLEMPVTDASSHYFRIQMREGVVIDLIAPAVKIAEKADAALRKYASLSDEERTFGFITVVDGTDGIRTDYSRNSALI